MTTSTRGPWRVALTSHCSQRQQSCSHYRSMRRRRRGPVDTRWCSWWRRVRVHTCITTPMTLRNATNASVVASPSSQAWSTASFAGRSSVSMMRRAWISARPMHTRATSLVAAAAAALVPAGAERAAKRGRSHGVRGGSGFGSWGMSALWWRGRRCRRAWRRATIRSALTRWRRARAGGGLRSTSSHTTSQWLLTSGVTAASTAR